MSDTPSRSLRLLAGFLLVAAGIVVGLLAAGVQRPGAIFSGKGNTRIDQGMVLDRLRSVANLVTTEVALRDVVTYQNTRLGSTKRSLVVVTGKALVGFDLGREARARIDEPSKTIELTLPHARLIGVDILQLKTYDESGGLWNPFHPSDRDTIYQVARERLKSAAGELGVREHAEAGARSVLAALFAADGYEVRVSFGLVTESRSGFGGRTGTSHPRVALSGPWRSESPSGSAVVRAVEWLRLGIDVVGALVIALGVVLAIAGFVARSVGRRTRDFARPRIGQVNSACACPDPR